MLKSVLSVFTPIALILMTFQVLPGCGLLKPKHRHKHTPTLFYKGDPMNLLQGTRANPNSFFSESNLDDFKGFDGKLSMLLRPYGGKEMKAAVALNDAEGGNEADDGSEANVVDNYAVRKEGTRTVYSSGNDQKSIDFLLIKSGDLYKVDYLRVIDGDRSLLYPIDVLHYSINEARDRFSILAKLKESDEVTLLSMQFTKNFSEMELPENTDREFNYLIGPGIPVRWQEPLTIDICGTSDSAAKDHMRAAVDAFAPGGSLGYLSVAIREPQVIYPLGDVTQNCFIHSDKYLFEDSSDTAVMGVTIPIFNKTTRAVVGGTIVISQGGIDKVARKYGEPTVNRKTYTHELGHLLGFDHEFEDDASGKPIASIMDYEQRNDRLTTHDKKMIEATYPAKLPEVHQRNANRIADQIKRPKSAD